MAPKKTPTIVARSKTPTTFLYREVQPDWGGLFTALSKVDLTKPVSWIKSAADGLVAIFKLKPRTAGEEAFLLFQRSLTKAVTRLLEAELQQDDIEFKPATKAFAASLDLRLKDEPVELGANFVNAPGRAKIVATMAGLVASWLKAIGFDERVADGAVISLPAYFVGALNAELGEHSARYPKLSKQFVAPLRHAAEAEMAWLQYHVDLYNRANPPVLNLGVSLEDVYVELRAYTAKPSDGRSDSNRTFEHHDLKIRTVGMLQDLAEAWIEDPTDAVFVLSGGPGAGKSAFAKRFAAWRAWTGPNPWQVLFVPLHRFKLGTELAVALKEFAIRELAFDGVSFDLSSDMRLFIIFDGLDELAKQGKLGEELAADFYAQVDEFLKECNRGIQPIRIKVMLCGRPVAVSNTKAEIRQSERVRNVLPYFLSPSEKGGEWRGRPKLLEIDQREEWWQKYGNATNDPSITGVPPDVRTEKLDPLTAEPILNGLIAKCRKEHTIAADTNRAQIYEWLLGDVLNRVHDASGKQHLKDSAIEDIARLLEEVAVTAWHNGDVRATTKSRVLIRCEKTDQQGLLNRVFPDQQKSDVSSLFLAFYFQEADKRQDQEQAFEFSHKSFGEYLLARRLVNFVRDMTKRIADEAWDADTALKKWVELYGPRPVNDDLCDFIKDISDRETIETRNEWRKAILKLLFRASKRGMPMAQMELANFAEMERQNRNAIENLFGTHSALYDIGQPVFPFDTSGESSLVSFLMRVPNRYQNWFPVHRMFRGLDFSHSFFQRALLDGVDLQGENLRECEFLGSSLIWANFEGADLTGVHFQSVTYGWGDRPQMVEMVTDCRNANFRNATLCQTRWGNVELENANFEGADLTGAHITDAQLRQTIGEPRLMTNGKPPKRGWRTANSRKRRKTSGSDAGLNERP